MSSKSVFIGGVIYTGIAKYSGIIISIIITAILARLITPAEFGVVAIATIFINFFSTLTTVGISPAIIQNKTITNDELRSLNSSCFLLAFVVTLLYLLAIPVIVNFYEGYSNLSNVMVLLGVNIFFSIAAIAPNAIILKEKYFKFIAVRTLSIQVVLGILSVVAALLGAGVYALLINPVIGSILLLIVNFKKCPIGFSAITKKAIMKILSFSLYQTLFNIVYLCYRNFDKLVVGKSFGMSSLGYYEKSYRLMMLPLENVSSVLSPVLHPILSEYQDRPEHIWNAYLKMLKTLAEFSFFLSVLCYFLADGLVLAFYGDNWRDAIPVFRILSLSMSFQLLQAPIGAVLQSINRVKGLFYSALCILGLVCLFSALAVALNNLMIVPIGLDVSFCIGFIIYQFYVSMYLGKSVFVIFRLILPDLFYAVILFVVCYFVTFVIRDFSEISKALIFLLICFFWFGLLYYRNKLNNFKDLLLSIIGRIKNK